MMRSDEGFATKRSWVFLVAIAVIAVLVFPSSDLFAVGPCDTNASCETGQTTGGWRMPVAVGGGEMPILNPTQLDWYEMAWDTFVAMNWPYLVGGEGGEPDKSKCICLPDNCPTPDECVPTAWMTYMSKDQTFLADGLNPRSWTDPVKQIPGFNGTHACAPFTGDASCLPVFGELSKTEPGHPVDEFDEAFTNRPLLDTNLNYVLFETRLNQSEFNYLSETGYYNAQCQKDAFPTAPPAKFVPIPKTGSASLPDYARQGAVEVKAAWRQLDEVPADLHYRYYTQQAYYEEPSENGTVRVGPVTLGLVGFHILRLTPSTGKTWYWATFSQVDNVEITNMAEPTPPEPSFNRNISPPSPYFECCDPMPVCANGQTCPPCTVSAGEALPLPTCVDVSRNPDITGDPHEADLDSVNADYQSRLQGTPWVFYRLLNTLNPKTDDSCPTSDMNCTPPPFHNDDQQMNRAWIVNPVLETYGQVLTPNCNSCHGRAFPIGAGPGSQYHTPSFQIFTFLLQMEAEGTVCELGQSCGGTTHTVSVRDPFSFVPANITVAPGDTVKWVLDNTVETHTITSQLGGINCANCPGGGGGSCGTLFGSGDVSGNQTFTYQIPLNQTANIPYVCRYHCEEGMTGLITVEGCPEPIPAVSEWSLIILTVLAFTAVTVLFRRRRRAAT